MIAVFDHTATLGTNLQRGQSTARNALKFTLFVPATIVAYSVNLAQSSTTGEARVALFDHDSSTDSPGSIVAGSTVLKNASDITTSAVLYQLDLATPLSLAAGVYWLIQDDNANASANVQSGLYTGANDGWRKLYNGNATVNYTWSWALWADDTYVPLGYERYYVDPSDSSSAEHGTSAEPFKSLQTALTQTCNKTFVEPIQIRCRTSGSVADTTRASTAALGQMSSSATNYLEIVAETGHRAGTSWDTSKYHLYPAYSVQGGTALEIAHAYSRVDGLQIGISTQTTTAEIVYWTGTNGRISNCFIRGINSSEYTRGLSIVNGLTVWNCIICNLGTGSGMAVVNHGNSSIYSSTLIGPASGYGFYAYDGTIAIKNTYVKASSGNGFGADTPVTSLAKTNCASADSTADDTAANVTATNCIVNIAFDTTQFTNVTAGSEDFALPAGSALIGVGTDTSGDSAPLNFTVDINGATRTTTWDIGADEYITAGGGSVLLHAQHYYRLLRG